MEKRFLSILFAFALMKAMCLPSFCQEGGEWLVHYSFRLERVECSRECGAEQEIRSEVFFDLDSMICQRYHYKDDVLSMSWYVSDIAFNYTIKTDSPLPLLIASKDIYASYGKKKHARLGYDLDGSNDKPVFRVLKSSFLTGFLVPRDNYPKAKNKDIAPILPNTFDSMEAARQVANEQIGKQIKLFLPVVQGNVRYNYCLTFTVEDASVFKKKTHQFNEQPADVVTLEAYQMSSHINYFNRLCPQEKVYLHLDNTAYFQGETIWYAANVVNASDNRVAGSKILYVELLSPTGVILKQQKLKVVKGRCHGSFALIDTSVKEAVEKRGAIGYPSGYYQIRAYTRAMLNFDDAGIYSRVIPVYKAPEEEGQYDNPVMRQYSGKETYRPKETKPDKLNVSFYPEGGHLIDGISTRIAFKATDEHGQGVEIERVSLPDGTELSVPLQHKGMGCFMLTPNAKEQKVRMLYGGKEHVFSLPAVETNGYALRVEKPAEHQLLLSLMAKGMTAGKKLAFTITSSGRCLLTDTISAGEGTEPAVHSLQTNNYPTGVCQVTIFDNNGTIYAQRLFFVDNGIATESVSVTSDKATVRPFEEIHLNLKTTSPRQNTFSLAVRDASDYGTAYHDDIRTYLLLSSELKGLIEEPQWYFGTEEKSVRENALDLLMMVQGWTRYNWQQMAGVKPFVVRHYTEGQLVVDGWAFSRIKETPLTDTKVLVRLTSPDRSQRQTATVTTDSLGYWSVGLQDFEGEWDLYMETRQKKGAGSEKTTRVRMERASRPSLYAYTPLEKWLPKYTWSIDSMLTVEKAEDSEYRLPTDSHVLDEVTITGRRKYIDFYTFKAFDAEKDAEMLIDEGSYTYKVEDYLREKGYDVTLSTGDAGDFISPTESTESRFPYYRQLVTAAPINGHRTFWYVHEGKQNRTSPAYFAGYALDIEEVKSIIVYDSPMIYSTFPGLTQLLTHDEIETLAGMKAQDRNTGLAPGLYIVDIELNPSRKRRTYVDKNSRYTTFSGYTPVVEFYSPTYPDGPIPGEKDYRRTLYWNPEVTTDDTGNANVSFYNNGYSRAFTISAEGLTPGGTPILNEK
ncbi:MAG: hypothetical protein J6Y84_08740 [Bacteroidaceae bacterium]|nr:hypothetical protein [Bacteroidaceae bacterium]